MLYKLFEEVISWDYKNGFLLIFWHCLYFTATNLYPLMEYYIEWWWYSQFHLWSALFRMYGYFIYVLVWFHIFLHLNILEIFCNQSIYGSIDLKYDQIWKCRISRENASSFISNVLSWSYSLSIIFCRKQNV